LEPLKGGYSGLNRFKNADMTKNASKSQEIPEVQAFWNTLRPNHCQDDANGEKISGASYEK
jgi:hypothetical protein